MHPARHATPDDAVVLHALGRVDYAQTFQAMQEFTRRRSPQTADEIWLLEHPPVFTMGLKGRGGGIADIGGIPLVYTDRGGDMTYHGPGQLVIYVLMDLQRRGWGPKRLVGAMEQAVIQLLSDHGIRAERRAGAPGVYVNGSKIAALGLRIKQGRSYHGLALNVDMDLAPFSRIDPCGYAGQPVTQLADLGITHDVAATGLILTGKLTGELGYTHCQHTSDRQPFSRL